MAWAVSLVIARTIQYRSDCPIWGLIPLANVLEPVRHIHQFYQMLAIWRILSRLFGELNHSEVRAYQRPSKAAPIENHKRLT